MQVPSYQPPVLSHRLFYVTTIIFQELLAMRKCCVMSSIHGDIFSSSLESNTALGPQNCEWFGELRIFRGPVTDRYLSTIILAEPLKSFCHKNPDTPSYTLFFPYQRLPGTAEGTPHYFFATLRWTSFSWCPLYRFKKFAPDSWTAPTLSCSQHVIFIIFVTGIVKIS